MSRKRTVEDTFTGQNFGKFDLDRVGFFNDSFAGTFDVYRDPLKFFEAKGRQFLGGSANVFFEKKFQRIFEGEALTEPWREEVKKRLQDEKKKIGGHMLPASPPKKHSTPGDWHGCFDKPSYFSRILRPEAKRKVVGPNMKIKPNPLGGPGYVNICLNPYPSYSHEPYYHVTEKKAGKKVTPEGRFLTASMPLNYFPPNPYKEKTSGPTYLRPVEIVRKRKVKRAPFYVPFPKESGGNHAGCFSKFPEYYPDPYIKIKKKVIAKPGFKSGGPFLRSKYTNSIITQITRISCNVLNYPEYREKAYPVY